MQQIERKLESREGFTIFSRLEGGDELYGQHFHPPVPAQAAGDRRRPIVNPYERRDGIIAALDGLAVDYPLALADGYRARRLKRQFGLRDPSSGALRTDDGGRTIVRMPVSATFGIAYTPVPASLEEFKSLQDAIDSGMMRVKANRRRVKTGGVVVSLAA
jgi:hypothetical protein